MRKTLMILFLIYSISAFAQQENKIRSVEIKVKSVIDNLPIEAAKVDIEEYERTETDSRGIAPFELPEGNYRLEIYATGYEYYTHTNFIKVTEDNNTFIIKLTPLPENTFRLYGKVVEKQDKTPIDSVEVFLKAGQIEKSTLSSKFGYFDFVFQNNELEIGQSFSIDVKKKGYEVHSYEGGFYKKEIPRLYFELQKKNQSNSVPPLIVDNKPKIPLLTFSAVPEFAFFAGNIQVQASSGFLIRWNLLKKRKKITLGVGWHSPIHLSTKNTFETLAGKESEIETKYKINSLGMLNLRYYINGTKNKGTTVPFVSIGGFFQESVPSISEEETYYEPIDPYFKFVPKVSGGISIKKKYLELEPFMSMAYFQINSQNFIFNYFGNADPYRVRINFFQIAVGLNLELTIFNY